MNRAWSGCLTLIIVLTQAGSDWLNCAHITECYCKWSSGKKTASCVSAGLKRLPNLAADIQVLDLHGNPLKVLEEDDFANIGLLNLQRMNLSSTSLQSLHPNTFRELRILIELDLSQNDLLHLSPDTFRGADRLRVLILNDNPLRFLVAEQFPPLKHLKKLEISRCKLRNVHPFAFVNLQALETINIHQNLLSSIHQDTFNLPVLKTLTLSDNPWNCDCRLREFHDWFLNSNLGNEQVFCRSPEIKANMPWRSLKRDDFICLPSAFSSPTVIRTEEGVDISFGCFVKGDPKPSVTWLFRQKHSSYWT